MFSQIKKLQSFNNEIINNQQYIPVTYKNIMSYNW